MKRVFALLVVSLLLASCGVPEGVRQLPRAQVTAAYTDKEVNYPVLYGTSRMPNASETG